MKKEDPRPYFQVRHEYEESLKAYCNAATMLHSAVRTAIQLAKTPESALRLLQGLKEHDDKFYRVSQGEEG